MRSMHSNPHNAPDDDPLWGLPDPDHQPAFYQDVALKRALAWLVDTVVVLALTALAVVLTVGLGLLFAVFLFLLINFAAHPSRHPPGPDHRPAAYAGLFDCHLDGAGAADFDRADADHPARSGAA